jgi:hypothetical protein
LYPHPKHYPKHIQPLNYFYSRFLTHVAGPIYRTMSTYFAPSARSANWSALPVRGASKYNCKGDV